MTEHFVPPIVAAAGYGALGCASRWENNDSDALMEATLLDIAAAITALRRDHGVERIISIGHSGGGGLFAFYQSQATTSPADRLTAAPSGDPPDLRQCELPALSGMVLLNAHKGEGHSLLTMIDPAVSDEADPLATDWTLDMFDPRNGYREPPASSTYSAEFVARYRAAQRDRVRRLDATAFAHVSARAQSCRALASPSFSEFDATEQATIRRAARGDRYMVIYRTWADLSFSDLSLDRSDRHVTGNLEATNFSPGGLARVMTPRGWLSTWSGMSTRMETDAYMPHITIPTLMVVGTADDIICGTEYFKSTLQASGATDKTLVWIKGGDHGLAPVEPAAAGQDTQAAAANAIVEWLTNRFTV
jgi:pimeloyl-ACP methyl ester carboxylesterase